MKTVVAPLAKVAEVGLGPVNASGWALPILMGAAGTTLMAVAWPRFETVTRKVKAWPKESAVGVSTIDATEISGAVWILTLVERVTAPEVTGPSALAMAVTLPVPEVVNV